MRLEIKTLKPGSSKFVSSKDCSQASSVAKGPSGIQLALYKNHYFINEKTPVSRRWLNNYNKIE